METTVNYHDDYSNSYREQLANAILESKKLGFIRTSLISEQTHIPDKTLRITNKLTQELLVLLDNKLPSYWGNSCQTLSSHFFAYLNSQGIAAEIILGNVIINGIDEFETTLESLQREVHASESLPESLPEYQAVHAWVSLGDDTIIDAALPPRLVKHYNAPPQFNDMTLIGRASEMSVRYKLRYEPILVGSEFFAKTNPPDPMDLLNELLKLPTPNHA